MAEPNLLLDTDVLIEILRGQPKAASWLKVQGPQIVGLPVLACMEVLQGARNQREQRQIARQIKRYSLIHLEKQDSEQALTWFEMYHLSHGIGIMDCLVASSATRLGLPFYTFNTKHYRVLPNLDAQVPYKR